MTDTYARGSGRRLKDAIALVFVSEQERPGGSDFVEDFVWRRTHAEPAELKLAAARTALAGLGVESPPEDLRVDYDRKAGCSMCPCSPGFVIRSETLAPRHGPVFRYEHGFGDWHYPVFHVANLAAPKRIDPKDLRGVPTRAA